MTVYVVVNGENYEGGEIKGVYANHSHAVREALKVKTCFPGGWQLEDDDIWQNGCDFVKVESHEVIE